MTLSIGLAPVFRKVDNAIQRTNHYLLDIAMIGFLNTYSLDRSAVQLGLGPRNRPFPSSLGPLYQNEVRCLAFDMETIVHSHSNKTHFHKKGCALGLILKVRVFGTRKWSIEPTPSCSCALFKRVEVLCHPWQMSEMAITLLISQLWKNDSSHLCFYEWENTFMGWYLESYFFRELGISKEDIPLRYRWMW